MNQLGQRIRELREERSMKQSELAGIIEVLPSRISQWETGARDVPSEYIVALSRALEVTADDLLSANLEATGA